MNTNIRHEPSLSVLEILQADSDKQIAAFPKSNIADSHTNYHGPLPYHLNYCGFQQCAPRFRFGPSVRSSYLLHIVEKGRGTYRVHGKTEHSEKEKVYNLGEKQIFLIYPGDLTVYQADETDPWHYCWIGFGGYRADFILSQMGFSREHHVIDVRDTAPLSECIARMLDTHQITLPNELVRESLLLRFFALILDQAESPRPAVRHSRTAYASVAMQYLTDHFMQKIRIADIADYIGVDRSHLSKSFHAQYGMSPQEYLIRLRMEKAAELMRHSDATVAEVALKCGYPDALAFTKMFRKYYGSAPSDYREKKT